MKSLVFLLLCALTCPIYAANFTIINGQIFTPGLAIIDAPQPNTPEGGDSLQVAIDISGDGRLQQPPYPANAPTAFHNITIFLTSYITGLNLTITNGTAGSGNFSLGNILAQEPGSTVKHVNWVWPSCFIGNGPPTDSSSARGVYNISIHQSFVLNNTNYYTIFDLPISVTNSISADTTPRANCSVLQNPLLSQAALDASANTIPPDMYPWTNGQGVQTVIPEATSAVTAFTSMSMTTMTATSTMTGAGGAVSTITGTVTSSSISTSTGAVGSLNPTATPLSSLGVRASGMPLSDLLVSALALLILGLVM